MLDIFHYKIKERSHALAICSIYYLCLFYFHKVSQYCIMNALFLVIFGYIYIFFNAWKKFDVPDHTDANRKFFQALHFYYEFLNFARSASGT